MPDELTLSMVVKVQFVCLYLFEIVQRETLTFSNKLQVRDYVRNENRELFCNTHPGDTDHQISLFEG